MKKTFLLLLLVAGTIAAGAKVWICSGQSNMQITLRVIRTSDPQYTLRPIMTAGDDQVFYPADRIDLGKQKGEMTVGCSRVARVASVRYAYYSFPDANLTNTYGLPAFPFRTDTWEVQGKIIEDGI